MVSLLLFREHPLSAEERSALPTGCEPVDHSTQKIVAMAQVRGPTSMLLQMAVSMARAVPDATFGYEEGFPTVTITPPPPPSKAEEDDIIEIHLGSEEDTQHPVPSSRVTANPKPKTPVIEEKNTPPKESESPEAQFQKAIDQNQIHTAIDIFSSHRSLQNDVVILNRLLRSNHTPSIFFLCRAAKKFQWKSLGYKLRNYLSHTDPSVRIEVLDTIAQLAGAYLTPSVLRLFSDPNPAVQEAAKRAYEIIKAKSETFK
ncbi:MAG: HEAT repeat domain-containing protein [Myxococcota bacterium]|nr:HEAT repeat domain-containing protein [Myxococcota bacterium]